MINIVLRPTVSRLPCLLGSHALLELVCFYIADQLRVYYTFYYTNQCAEFGERCSEELCMLRQCSLLPHSVWKKCVSDKCWQHVVLISLLFWRRLAIALRIVIRPPVHEWPSTLASEKLMFHHCPRIVNQRTHTCSALADETGCLRSFLCTMRNLRLVMITQLWHLCVFRGGRGVRFS